MLALKLVISNPWGSTPPPRGTRMFDTFAGGPDEYKYLRSPRFFHLSFLFSLPCCIDTLCSICVFWLDQGTFSLLIEAVVSDHLFHFKRLFSIMTKMLSLCSLSHSKVSSGKSNKAHSKYAWGSKRFGEMIPRHSELTLAMCTVNSSPSLCCHHLTVTTSSLLCHCLCVFPFLVLTLSSSPYHHHLSLILPLPLCNYHIIILYSPPMTFTSDCCLFTNALVTCSFSLWYFKMLT